MENKNRSAYQIKYKKDNYDSIQIMFDKGELEGIKKIAEQNGESLNAYIVRLIKEDMMERWY